MAIRNVQLSDLQYLGAISRETSFLWPESGYTYWVLARYFGETSFVIEEMGRVHGFIFCINATISDSLFIWQFAVSKHYRGQIRGRHLFERAIQFALQRRFRRVEFSVDSNNNVATNTISKALATYGLSMTKIGSAATHYLAAMEPSEQSQSLYAVLLPTDSGSDSGLDTLWCS